MTATDASVEAPVIRAAGGLLYRDNASGRQVLVVLRKRYGDCTLPKGKLKAGESFLEAAVREVGEETGCTVQVEEYLGALAYRVKEVPKIVLFWRMSVLEEHEITDHDEVDDAVWMSVSEAAAKLSHAEERAFLARFMPVPRQYQSPGILAIRERSILNWPWSQGKSRSYARLLREFEVCRLELAFREQRSTAQDRSWISAAQDHLTNVKRYLEKEDSVDGGWLSLNAARRDMVFVMSPAELAIQAAILREEAQKISSWRCKVIKSTLAVADEELTFERIREAVALRDDYAGNQYQKIWLMADQLGVLLKLCGLGLPLLVPVVVFFSRHGDATPAPWGYQMVTAVLFFGLLGASFSVAQSLILTAHESKIPEGVANHYVTIARALFGGAAGLAGYALLGSKLINVVLNSDKGPGGGLAIAFLFGYAGERIVARFADVVAPAKS